MHTILHLSDLHYGDMHRYDQGIDGHAVSLAAAVTNAVRSRFRDRPLDALVLTGDFFSHDLPSDKAKATDGITSLIELLRLSRDRVVMLPGNHDLSWDPNFHHQPYRFYDEMVGDTKTKGYVADGLPGLLVLPPSPSLGSRKGLALLLLNSCVMEGQKTSGFGRVGDKQLDSIAELLIVGEITRDTHILIAALHHHLLPVVPLVRNWTGPNPKDSEPALTSLTVDAVAVLQRLTELGFSLAIHGHQHVPAVRRFEDVLHGQQSIGVCAAGSCGSKDAIRHFFLYEVAESQTRIWDFEQSRHNDSSFSVRQTPLLVPHFRSSSQTAQNIQDNLERAGIHAVYFDRSGHAEKALEDAFSQLDGGEVRLTGASLRLFLGPGLHFYESVRRLLGRRSSNEISVRAIMCDPESNRELPVRSFIEEFEQDGSHPRARPFDWSHRIDFDFSAFEARFFAEHGPSSPNPLRVIEDLKHTHAGIVELSGVAKSTGNRIEYRETAFAPYCTAVIFPAQAFYTPNLLSADVPANLPMIVFDASSEGYHKLSEYFEFQWWLASGVSPAR